MNSIDKAKKLIETFGKELALKVVEEIQEIKSVYHDDELYDYWEEVKQEIEDKIEWVLPIKENFGKNIENYLKKKREKHRDSTL